MCGVCFQEELLLLGALVLFDGRLRARGSPQFGQVKGNVMPTSQFQVQEAYFRRSIDIVSILYKQIAWFTVAVATVRHNQIIVLFQLSFVIKNALEETIVCPWSTIVVVDFPLRIGVLLHQNVTGLP